MMVIASLYITYNRFFPLVSRSARRASGRRGAAWRRTCVVVYGGMKGKLPWERLPSTCYILWLCINKMIEWEAYEIKRTSISYLFSRKVNNTQHTHAICVLEKKRTVLEKKCVAIPLVYTHATFTKFRQSILQTRTLNNEHVCPEIKGRFPRYRFVKEHNTFLQLSLDPSVFP